MSPKLTQHLNQVIRVKEFRKGEYLLKNSQVSNNIYFLLKGLVRSYHVKDGTEINSWFMKEMDVVISVKSFYRQETSSEYIQTLEDSVTAFIDYTELQYIYHNFLEFNFIGRVLTEKYYIQSEDRLYSLRKQKGIEKYKYLLENHGELVQRVSSKHLASYLGVSVETLSRIKSQARNF